MLKLLKKHLKYLIIAILIMASGCIGGGDENIPGKKGSTDQLTPPIAMPSPTLDQDRLDEISFE